MEEVRDYKRRKISAPHSMLYINSSEFLTPENSQNQGDQTSTDNIESSSQLEAVRGISMINNDLNREYGVGDNFLIGKDTPNLSDRTLAMATTPSTSYVEEPFQVRQFGTIMSKTQLPGNSRNQSNVARSVSDIWLLLEGNLVQSTTKKKTIRYSHIVNEQSQSTPRAEPKDIKIQVKMSSQPPFKTPKKQRVLKPKISGVQVLQSDPPNARDSSTKLSSSIEEPSSPLVNYTTRASRRIADLVANLHSTELKKKLVLQRDDTSSSDLSSIDSDMSFETELLFEEQPKKSSKRKIKKRPDQNLLKPVSKVVKSVATKENLIYKEKSHKLPTKSIKPKKYSFDLLNNAHNSLCLLGDIDRFHDQVYGGLKLVTTSLLDRMKLIHSEILKKEHKLRCDLERRLEELNAFQKAQQIEFTNYLTNLLSQMNNSENELQKWMEKSNN